MHSRSASALLQRTHSTFNVPTTWHDRYYGLADRSGWIGMGRDCRTRNPRASNGEVKVIKLLPAPRTSHFMALGLSIAPDGSAWVTSRDKVVRITKDDRIEVMVIPGLASYPEIHFSNDGTVWLKTSNAIMHVAPPNI